jgi:hypothetical protein
LGALHDLLDRYGDQVAFFIVYIKEAHPEDGWVVTDNREEGIAVIDPSSEQERSEVAEACVFHTAIRVPVLMDSMENTVASASSAATEGSRFRVIGVPLGFSPSACRSPLRRNWGPSPAPDSR